jgi:hypothetical protein
MKKIILSLIIVTLLAFSACRETTHRQDVIAESGSTVYIVVATPKTNGVSVSLDPQEINKILRNAGIRVITRDTGPGK